MLEQAAIHIDDAKTPQSAGEIRVGARPELPLSSPPPGAVSLRPGLFKERRELTKAYMNRLRTENLLQNHYLEAGIRIDRPVSEMHEGWESPHCQLRGHFAGHWLSAASRFAAIDGDRVLAARSAEMVAELKKCQELNGDGWVGSIPEKYFGFLVDRSFSIWSPQYTLHKTLMGLYDAYAYTGNEEALAILGAAADWYRSWSASLIERGKANIVYKGECSGMLELWADLYGATGDGRYLELATRYAMPDMFRRLLAGEDPLTNNHANASVPWIQGAARLYEVTGDARYREIVLAFWRKAVEERGMFATTGGNAGEFWVPTGGFGRFVGDRTQEHCTVYNMIRVAQFLFRWTGEAKYCDYIERALYNGVLAQQNPNTGAISYFLPLQPGARKKWGSETKDFWCCHGTLLQAQAMYEDCVYYRAEGGIAIGQFIASRLETELGGAKVSIEQSVDFSDGGRNQLREGDESSVLLRLAISAAGAGSWSLKIRQPSWASGPARISIGGEAMQAAAGKDGFIVITREWGSTSLDIVFSKRVRRESLPGDESRFALVDGPIVLAALASEAPVVSPNARILPQYEHQYVAGVDWRSDHYWLETAQGKVALKPLYLIADEPYSVYLEDAKKQRT
jgi:Uncharacterized protein conserved in bacteria